MNKQCYRIIFSRTHGELRVVSELASSCSTQPGQSRGAGSARLWVTLRPALWLIGMILFAGPALASGIVADGQIAPALRPEVINTQNGLPQVNINAPNQAGVSHNQYQQFDVGQQGAILNNSAVMTSTQLSGYIQGNAKLNPNAAPAKVIINEVNSNNPSQLRGFLEVAGGKAQVVVANPSGIVCDGCGTINAGRMTLTTGKPQLNTDGSLAGYKVERGLIRIEGGGLNGDLRHDTEYADILARAVQVNAGVWAREEIAVVAGRNQISADAKTVTALSGTDGNAPEMAIDMGQMGGMYSGHIRMVGTEAGVGVRDQGGQLQAEHTLSVSSEGKLTWQSGTAEPYTQAGGDITLIGRDGVEHQGKLYSGGQLQIESRQGEIKQSGTLAAAGNVTLRAGQGIQSSGHLLAGSDANSSLIHPADLTLESQGDIRASGSLMSQQSVKVTGRKVDVSQSRLSAEQAQLTSQGGDVALQQTQLDSDQLTINSQGNVYSQQAEIRAGRWQITAGSLFNQGGIWSQVGAGESHFALTGALDNTDGSIETRQLDLNTAALNNLRGRIVALDNTAQHWRVGGLLSNQSGVLGSNGSLQLDAVALDNQQGTLQSQSSLTLAMQRDVNNRQGKLLSGGNLLLNSQGLLSNQTGEIRGQNLQIAAQGLNNAQGQLISQGRLQLNARQSIDNQQGLLEAGDVLDVTTGGNVDNRHGTAVGAKQANITAASLDNAAGKLQSGGGLTLNATGNVNNQAGTLTAQQNLDWQGGALSLFNNDAGMLLSGGAMTLQGGQLNNRQQGLVQSQQGLTLHLAGTWDNQGGKLASGGSTTVRALNLINAQGEIQALDTLNMQFTRALDNRNGNIISQMTQRLQAENIFNNQGWMGSLGALAVVSQGFDNREGQVVSQQDANVSVTTWDNQFGTLQSAASLMLHVAQDISNQGGKISAQARLWLQGLTDGTATGILYNAGGQLLAGEQLRVQAQGIDNQQNGLLYSQKQLQLTLNNALDNRLGKVQSGEGMQVSAAQLLNSQGIVDSQQQLNLQLAGLLDNTHGTLRANQAQQINADRILNAQGVISSLANIQLTANQLDNTTGMVISQGAGDYHLNYLNNQQGKIHSGGPLMLSSSTVDNQLGQLVSSQSLALNGENVDNHHQGIISSQGVLTVHVGQLNNRDGGLLIGSTHTDVSARTLDNTAGRVQSTGTLRLSQLDQLDNRQGAILSNNDLSISGGNTPSLTLFNQGGNIQSGGALTVTTQSFDNQGGTLLSQRELSLTMQQDYTHRAGDTLSSNTAVTLRVAGVLTNLVDWLLPGDLTVYSTHLTNLASLVGNTLYLTTGTLLNQGRIEADTLTIDSDNLDNQTTLMADNLTVNSRIIDNHGREALIAATQNISLMTGERLTNRDGALIYSAGALQLSSTDLIENRASNIEAEGDLTLTAKRFDNLREGLEITRAAESSDYKWHRYNYYWRSFGENVNTDVSTMAPNTQRLTFRDDAAAENNPYGTLLNIDAAAKRAEVRVKDNTGQMINLWVNYLGLIPNADGSYAMTFYDVRGWNQDVIPTPYQNSFRREHDIGQAVVWDPERFLDIATAPFVSDYNNLRERTVTGTVTTDKLVSAGVGAFVLSGGNMVLHIADRLLNDASTLSSNGNLTIDGTSDIINRGYSVNERRQEVIVDHYDRGEGHWYPTHYLDKTTALTTIDGVISGYGNVTLSGVHLENTTVNQAQISSVEAAQKAAAAERAEWERNPLAVNIDGADWQSAATDLAPGTQPLTPAEIALTDKQHLGNIATNIPNNGLFRQQTSPASPYLVVTDPRFANKSNFLSSDYLLQRVGYDPSQVHKRLGDGYYEQRVVREQLLMLTGRPSLQGDDAMAQYQSLMNNGIKAATDFHLVPGVALTPSQIAALQQDIVWLVSENVDTADGPQTVWVPKVYLANSTIQLTGDGAVIAGGNLQLSTGSINNAGNLFADKALSIDTGQFLHQSGDIRADTISVQADSLSLSTNLQDALRQASMSARDIGLSGGDISLQGAKLSASDNLSLSASNSLNIGTARSATTADVSVISGSMGNRKREGMEEAGDRLAQVSGEWQQALGSSLTAGGNLSLKAGQDITLQGSEASAGGKTLVQAGGNVSLLADTTTNDTHLDANSRTSTVSNDRREESLHTSALSGNNGVTILAGGNFVAEGAQVESASGGIGLSAQQVTIKEARQQLNASDSEQSKVGKTQSQRQEDSASNTSQGSLFSAKEGVTVIAREGDITVQGSAVQSEKGTIGLKAAGDISLTASHDVQDYSLQGSSSSKGTLSSSQSAYQKEDHTNTANGSLLSGQEVILLSGKDINVMGSAIAASDDISLTAANNILVGTAENTQQSSSASQSKKTGFSGTGGIGVSYGTNSLNMTDTVNSVTSSGSTVGSTQGNVTLNAGNNLTVKGSDVLAGKDINLTGKEVNILAADNQSVQTHVVEQKQTGFTLALSGAVGSAMSTAVSAANDASTASTGRLAALDGMKSALGGVQAYQASELGAAEGKDPESLFGLNLSYGSQSSKSEQTNTQHQSQGSQLTAGGNLNIHATDTDINVQGSQLQAGKDIGLIANRDVNLWSGVNTSELDGSNESHGSSVGVGFNLGEGKSGLTINASGNKGKGSETGNGITHTETTVSAGNNLTIVSGRDTTLTGAQVSGDKVVMDVGRNLTLTSEQDSDNYDSKQQNASAGVSGGIGSFSASANLSQDKMHSTYDSVIEQTGVFAGKGGFDITVGEHTQLNGAVIGSTATADKNRLDTGTLGFSDIENKAEYNVEHQSIGISTGGNIGGQFAGNMANSLLVGVNDNGSDSSTTKSAVSDGNIIIRDKDNQKQDVADLSRDVEHANQTLSPIFDKEKEQQRLQEAQKIGEIGAQVMDIARTQGDLNGLSEAKKNHPEMSADELRKTDVYKAEMAKYGTGSAIQQGLQAATAAIQGLAGGDLAKAIAGGSAPYLAEVIHNMTTDPLTGKVNAEANLMAHAVVGAVVAQINGNSALAGASGAAMGEFIAQQLYPNIKREDLTEEQRQTISSLSTLAAGLAGGLTGDSSADAVAGAQAGKTAAENNNLSLPSGMADYGQAVASYAQYAQDSNLPPEQIKSDMERMVKGDLPEGADIIKAILENNPGTDTVMALLSAEDAKDYALALLSSIPAERVLSVVGKTAKVIDNKVIIKAAEKISTAKAGTQFTAPRDLNEQVLWNQVNESPTIGKKLDGMNNDPRFPVSAGFQKMEAKQKLSDGSTITMHYQYNSTTGKAYDMKITTPQRAQSDPQDVIDNIRGKVQ